MNVNKITNNQFSCSMNKMLAVSLGVVELYAYYWHAVRQSCMQLGVCQMIRSVLDCQFCCVMQAYVVGVQLDGLPTQAIF